METPITPSPSSGGKRPLWPWLLLAGGIGFFFLVAFLVFCYWYDQVTSRSVPQQPAPASAQGQSPWMGGTPPAGGGGRGRTTTPVRNVVDSGAFKLSRETAGTCTVMRPEGWTRPIVGEGNKTLDLSSMDKSLYAGYGIQAVNTQLAGFAGVYPPPMNDPELYSTDPAVVAKAFAKIIVGGLGGDPNLFYTREINTAVGDYLLRSVASSSHTGVVFYHRTGFPGDGYNYSYALPMYFALTRSDRWPSQGLMVAQVAASIRCAATFVPHASGPDIGSSSRGGGRDENGPTEAGYNPQLGTEYVHDPTTGENYVVDPSKNWSENGPNGPGYYAPKGGNDYVQLQPGRVD